MASGQCTMGAITNVSVWRPVQSVSPSFTMRAPAASDSSKNCPTMAAALALHTSCAMG